MKRQVFRKLHRWFGLTVALPMMLQGMTGAILVAAPVVDQWRAPALAVPASAVSSARLLIDAATKAAPGLRPVAYQAASGYMPAAVDFAAPGNPRATLRLWIDPASNAVLGRETNPDAFYRLVHSLHETLLLPFGRNIIGVLGICLCLLVITGAVLWLPPPGRRLAGLALPRKARGVRLVRELHAVVAVWLLLPLAFQAGSGVSMAFPNAARAVFGLPPMHRIQPPARPGLHGPDLHGSGLHGSGAADLGLADLATQAEANGATLLSLKFQGPGNAAMAMLQPHAATAGPPLRVAINGGSVTVLNDPRGNSAVLDWMRRLHGAETGGPVWKFIAFLTGISLPLLGITGPVLWLLRRRRSLHRHVQQRTIDIQFITKDYP